VSRAVYFLAAMNMHRLAKAVKNILFMQVFLFALCLTRLSLFACPQCDVMTASDKADPPSPYRCIASPIANGNSHRIHLTIKGQDILLTLGYYPGSGNAHSVAPVMDFSASFKRGDIPEIKQLLATFLDWDAIAISNNVSSVTKRIPCNIKNLNCFFHSSRKCLANKEEFTMWDDDVVGITSQDVPRINALLESVDDISKSWAQAKKEKQETETAVEKEAKRQYDLFQLKGILAPTNAPAEKVSNNPHNVLSHAAEQGDAESQYKLASCYMQGGAGVLKDTSKGIEWLRKAAEQGHDRAQVALATLYWDGDVVGKDFDEALKWYRKAADKGNAAAEFCLGHCYAEGEGVAKDKEEAVKWYTKSAERANADAQLALGSCLILGEGINKDVGEGVKWIRKAAKQGNADAGSILKQLAY